MVKKRRLSNRITIAQILFRYSTDHKPLEGDPRNPADQYLGLVNSAPYLVRTLMRLCRTLLTFLL